MITALRNTKLITSTKVRDGDWKTELEHRSEFARFLREIPDGFQNIARHPQKREIVRNHLKTFYMALPREREVDTVLERITNIASLAALGRDAIEKKALQHNFKREQWQTRKRCALCGYEFLSFPEVTLDHIIPLSLGGSEKADNWQLTCALCNIQKQEYWGVADLSRSQSLRGSQGNANFFALADAQVLDNLKLKNNPTRYWVLERDSRKCSCCGLPAAESQLYVGPRENGFLLVIDNLASYCQDCSKRNKVTCCKCP
jgi:5-methylcytosine-specific restriction endonuclease McrA